MDEIEIEKKVLEFRKRVLDMTIEEEASYRSHIASGWDRNGIFMFRCYFEENKAPLGVAV